MADKKRQQKLESLYREYKDYVFNYLCRITSDHDLSMDVTQIAFTKVFQDPKLMEIQHIKAYLLTIARNTLFDEWKRKKEKRLTAEQEAAYELPDDPGNQPLEQASQADMQDKVESAIALMHPRFRELMILRYTEDLPIKEIAQITHRTESDVKVSLHRARIRFERDFEIQMYSRVARSRDRCDELSQLLAPYEDREVPAETIKIVDRHLESCSICEQDKQTMKRSRELFTALPLIPAPLALDERMAEILQPGMPSLSADQANSAANDPGFGAGSVAQTATVKWVAGIATVAMLGGGASMLLRDKNQEDQALLTQGVNASVPSPAHQGPLGKVTLTATHGKSGQLIDDDITWTVYQMNGQTRRMVKTITQATPTLELPAGEYRLEVRRGPFVKKVMDLRVTENETEHQSIELESGRVNLSAVHADDAKAIDKVRWDIYSRSVDAPDKTKQSEQHIASQYGAGVSLLLPPGPYTVVASHEKAKISRDIELVADQVLDMPDFSFTVGELVLAARLTPDSQVQEGVHWSIYQPEGEGKERIIDSRYGGRVSFTLPAGRYRVQTRYENTEISTMLELESGKTLLREDIILGSGTVQLASRLSPDSPIQKGVNWQAFTKKGDEKKVFIDSKHGDTVSFTLPEGHYYIVASYKKAQVSTEVDVVAGKKIKAQDLILNAGVVTLRSRLSPDGPIQKGVNWQAFTKKGDEKKVFIDSKHGDTVSFTLPEGHYYIVASYKKAQVSTEVDVVAGKKIKAQDLILNAGVVTLRSRLSPDGPIQKGVNWQVFTKKGNEKKVFIDSRRGDTVSFTLPAGRYLAQARLDKAEASTEVVVVAGSEVAANDVLLNAGRLILSSSLRRGSIQWQVFKEQPNGEKKHITSKSGAEADLVLPAGVYTVSGGQGKNRVTKNVTIVSGKTLREDFDIEE